MIYGNKPADGGNLIIEDIDYDEFIKKDPNSRKYIKPLLGAVEYLHNKKRYCIWLQNIAPDEIRKCPMIINRIKQCKESRENSIAEGIRKFANTPTLFAQITQPSDGNYIIIPRVSSEKRRYIPMGFLSSEIKVTDAVQIVPNASIYDFAIAHQENDKAVMEAYGFNWKKMTESDCVAELMKMYQKIIKNLLS